MRKRVVIVGGGYGGLAAATSLAKQDIDVVLIDRQNHHLFQPLLYQVATAALSPADIAWPIRRIVRRQANARVIMGEVTGVDVGASRVLIGETAEPYDYLVLATGASHAYFGHEDWAPFALGLKNVIDATAIRRRILTAFEHAELESDASTRERLLNFVIIGGGPTGVEMAGAISELARKALAADFRRIDPRTSRVILIEAGPKLLAPFPDSLSNYAKRALEKLGVEVRLSSPVTYCGPDGVQLNADTIPSATMIWAAGVAASPAADWLQAKKDRNGRILVGARLEVPGLTRVFVIGDTALCVDATGRTLPGIATVAKQQGHYLGRLIAARLRGKAEPEPFRYRDVGQLATIGRRAALADLGRIRFKGRIAWWFWGLLHIYFLINNRSRLTVAIHWLWSYLTFDRGARLIVGRDPDRSSTRG
jgi:NADH dehydrogenase